MTKQFTGKHVLVTGASRGIGFAVAEAFLNEGANLTILASSEGIQRAATTLRKKCDRVVTALQVDIANLEDVNSQLKNVPPVDVLINNAGLEYITPIDDLSDDSADQFQRIININVLGTYYVTRTLLPKMQSGARIVITSSIWGKNSGCRVQRLLCK